MVFLNSGLLFPPQQERHAAVVLASVARRSSPDFVNLLETEVLGNSMHQLKHRPFFRLRSLNPRAMPTRVRRLPTLPCVLALGIYCVNCEGMGTDGMEWDGMAQQPQPAAPLPNKHLSSRDPPISKGLSRHCKSDSLQEQ